MDRERSSAGTGERSPSDPSQPEALGSSSATSSPAIATSGFIIGPVADAFLIIGAPIVALILAGPLFSLPNSTFGITIQGKSLDIRQVLILVFINAHLFLVYFRSHANQKIFQLYPLRFTAVPLLLFLVGTISPLALGIMVLVAVWWDVYHSSLQTFGFGRIYDSKQKNGATIGRELDCWMNLLVYLGPVLAGAHFADHLNSGLEGLQYLSTDQNFVSELLLQQTPDFLKRHQSYLTAAVLLIGVPFVVYYLYSYYRFQQQGYRVSWQKVWLMIITSAVSIYCWGFYSFIDAFWVMNFFHALQYFAIVSYAEKRNLSRFFRVDQFAIGTMLAIFWVTSFSLLYGVWSSIFAVSSWSASLVVTTSIMHFWYDGFIWSVAKKQV